jgi:SAM-dependent methyltransferase
MINEIKYYTSYLLTPLNWLMGKHKTEESEKKIEESEKVKELDKIFWPLIKEMNAYWKPLTQEEWTNDLIQFRLQETEPAIDLSTIHQIKEFRPGRALDLGCGTGIDTIYLLKKGWQVVSIDMNQLALDILQEQVKNICTSDELNRLTPLCCKIEDYPFNQKFHLINATRSLPFCDPSQIQMVWKRLIKSLEIDAFFVGQFYDKALYGVTNIPTNMVQYLMFKTFEKYSVIPQDETMLTVINVIGQYKLNKNPLIE